jgi:hypothetical protein
LPTVLPFHLIIKTMKRLLSLAALVITSTSALQAGTVTSAGTLLDLTTLSFGAEDVADLDAQGAGAGGFVLFNSVPVGTNLSNRPWNENMIDNSPAYITAIDGTGSTSSGGWANYDDVRIGGTTYNSGGIVRAGLGNGVEGRSFTFTVGAGVPPVFRIGLIADNSDGAVWDVLAVRVEAPGGSTASQPHDRNGGLDIVQFENAGALDGETYTVYGTSPPNGILIGGITFDSAIDQRQ